MTKNFAALAGLILVLSVQRPQAQGARALIYFVDIGTGAGTLIVSPTGKTLLVDGGPPGAGTTKIIPTLDALGIATVDYAVLTHYHIDHDAGLTEIIAAGRVGGIAYDNGDAPGVIPPSLTGSTGRAYTAYKNAIAAAGVVRATIAPGQVIDLGGGMRATCLVVGGRLLGGGSVAITNEDLNSAAISLLVEYNDFDFIVSGDLTGGGSTSTEKAPDVETWVGQLAGDVDVAQLNHHGSTTASNQRFLNALKAEVAVAETGSTNTFGHPNRETVNRFLNTPSTSGNRYTGTAQPPPGLGPVFYQIEQSSASDDRESQQGYFGATVAMAGTGTILLTTDGTTSYSMQSFDDGGVQIAALLHTYPIDGVSNGLTTDFPPTVIPSTNPIAPLAADPVVVSAQIHDDHSPVAGATLFYSLNGAPQPPLPMTPDGAVYVATIPAQADGTPVDYTVTGTAGVQTTTYSSGYFSGATPIASLRPLNANGEPLYAGYPARVRGLVTAGSGLFGAASHDDYIDDGSAAIGIYRSTNGISAFTPTTTGQTVEAVGHIESVGGRLRLDLTDSVEKTTSPWHTTILPDALTTPAPLVLTIAELNASPELYEGRLISVTGVSIVSGAIPAAPTPFDAFVLVGDPTGSVVMKIDHDTDVEGFTPPSLFTLTGIVQQDDFLRPFDSNYDIAPRSRVDLGAAAPAPPPLLTIGDARADLVNNADLNATPDFIPDLIGKTVKVRGTVTSINFRPAGTEYYIQDATGGIDIFASTTSFGSFGIGTTVEAVGSVTQFSGLTELQLASVTPTGSATPPLPQVITLSQLADGGAGEAVEGRLIRVDGVTITSGSFPASGASGNVTITDPTGSALMRIDSDTNIDGTPATAGTFSVIALASQFASAPPFDSGYQILPRSLSDIVVTGASSVAAAPPALDFGSVAVGSSLISTVTVTNVGLSPVTLTPPFLIAGPGASEYAVGPPGTTALAVGAATTVSVTFAPATSGAKSAALSISTTGGGADGAVVPLTGLGVAPGSGPVAALLISEFRFRGPNGANDEFVELFNPGPTPVNVGGYRLHGSNSAGTTSTRATITAGRTIPPHGHYLLVNSSAGAPVIALADQTYGTGITDDGGIALFAPSPDDIIIDQVGLSAGSAFREGTPLVSLGSTNADRGYERKPGGAGGSTVDTGDNAGDFQVTAPSAPQNLASPTVPPLISAVPAPQIFGSVALGSSASATITITNHSTALVTLTTPFTITGADAAQFSAGAPGVSSLPGGSATPVGVVFTPTTLGAKTARLIIESSSGGSAGVDLAGTSVCPAIAVSGLLPGGTFGVPYAGAVTASGGTAPYAFGATGTLPSGLALASGGAFGGTPSLAGLYAFTVQATDANGCGGAADFSIAIARAAVPVVWAAPAAIVYGTALGGSQLNATADVAGAFDYTPVAGTVLDAGDGWPLHVAFLPADGVNYQGSSAGVTVDVTKRPLTATAGSTTREFGAANPPLTGSVIGVVNGDPINGAFTSPAAPASPEGTYPILASLLDPAGRLSNYIVGLVNGTLTVVDTHPPVLTLPSAVSATATTPSGVAVTYSASAADPVDGSRPIVCVPASGSMFPIGATTVHCSATDSNRHTAIGTFVVTVTTANVPGRMVGDGEIESGNTHHRFEFVVQEHASGAHAGAIVYRVRTRTAGRDRTDTFGALAVTSVTFYNVPGASPGPIPVSGIDTVTFDGVGHWNGRSGYRFTATAADAGEPGRNRDRFAITIADPTGRVVASTNATITGGNIQSLRLTHK